MMTGKTMKAMILLWDGFESSSVIPSFRVVNLVQWISRFSHKPVTSHAFLESVNNLVHRRQTGSIDPRPKAAGNRHLPSVSRLSFLSPLPNQWSYVGGQRHHHARNNAPVQDCLPCRGQPLINSQQECRAVRKREFLQDCSCSEGSLPHEHGPMCILQCPGDDLSSAGCPAIDQYNHRQMNCHSPCLYRYRCHLR